ncbi:FAD-binding oxidoreductase [Desulfosudis oleivorans]|uniref:FAD linked oxidase domain protein n=1 Tax=Desulfosudis oleivorans (strain DSM 6200 / JCM 39069 / Hxd3) TaxID=96561 RepID=A8ZRP5_DESOH|nr:FAD-linked oxidase C-terminal domain-containing protein [Desulfosudis oleivorans]ABW65812.1 FAD linked oxidase domain protein [Desulfosudis oleivorans Hxd3]
MAPLTKKTIEEIQGIVGSDHCTTAPEDRVCYAYDASAADCLPDAVVFPADRDQVARVLALAHRDGFCVTPRGSGSGMTGGSVPVAGGVVMVLNRLNRILEIDTDNLVARVEPGVITGDFHKAVEALGLFYPPDPSSAAFSTLGGNVAECAGGPRAVKYGVTRDYVLGLSAVLPNGDIITTGVRTAKGVAGYDLTRLIAGSEGTLAVITEMTLRLLPLPEAVGTMTALFDDIRQAARTVSEIIRQRIVPRTLEFIDNASLGCVEKSLNLGLPITAAAMLLIEVDGAPLANTAALEKIAAICTSQGATQVTVADTKQAAEDLWRARKAISPALFNLAPDKINEDIVVPRSRIPDMVAALEALSRQTGLTIACFGHAGDGNIHVNIMADKKDPVQAERAKEATDRLFEETLRLGGTISGEHGIGITKAPYLGKEVGGAELMLMRRIKKVFDPNGILNPGKIFHLI